MKRVLLGVALSVACFAANAAPVLSCDEVNEVGEALTELGIALEDQNMEIGHGSPEHQALVDITVGLAEIAGAEEDEDLGAASIAMGEAWDANDRDAFTEALAVAVAKLAIIANNDCGG